MPGPEALPDEFALIAQLFAPLAKDAPGAYGLLDDAATIAIATGEELVVTKDLIVEGVHFRPEDPPDLIARKLIRVNVSDLAAKGATPLAYLLGLVLPRRITFDWMKRFADGLAADQTRYGMTLIGGDTTASDGPAVFSLTAFGTLPAGTIMRRGGARPGDLVCLSGTVGDAALGLKVLKGDLSWLDDASRAALIARYQVPEPRPELGARLRGLVHAALDVSDGLVADLGHLCEVSKVGAEIEAALLPLSSATQAVLSREPTLIGTVLTGGDDYEILFTVPPSAFPAVQAAAVSCRVPVTVIGRVSDGAGVRVIGRGGMPLVVKGGGFRHF